MTSIGFDRCEKWLVVIVTEKLSVKLFVQSFRGSGKLEVFAVLITDVDFPDELFRAHSDGNLVVFAGAGVSNPSPSSLPLFAGLTAQIGKSSGVPRREGESDDRYLGRLKAAGVHVHEAAARILVNPTTKPNRLHTDLTKLFPSAKSFRLVTTNFDQHFTTAASKSFGTQPEIFYAPALPLGDEGSGLFVLQKLA